jgi:hypothetical protein
VVVCGGSVLVNGDDYGNKVVILFWFQGDSVIGTEKLRFEKFMNFSCGS